MTKPHVLALGNFSEKTFERLHELFEVHYFLDPPNIATTLDSKTRDAIVAVLNEPNRKVSAQTIEALPNLKVIAAVGMGTDAIDKGAAKQRGIAVAITPNVLGDEVADLAIGMMLASTRQIVYADRFVREGKWLKEALPLGRSVGGKTMGVIGLGGIGEAIAERGAALKMNVLYHTRRVRPNVPYTHCPDLVDMARRSDVLMVACTGGPETAKLVSADVIAALGAKGTLVNVARGTVVDEQAMIAALKNGTLGFAALDVFENEPNINPELMQFPNVILQPHQGSATAETRTRMGMATIDNVLAELAGKPAPGRLS